MSRSVIGLEHTLSFKVLRHRRRAREKEMGNSRRFCLYLYLYFVNSKSSGVTQANTS